MCVTSQNGSSGFKKNLLCQTVQIYKQMFSSYADFFVMNLSDQYRSSLYPLNNDDTVFKCVYITL